MIFTDQGQNSNSRKWVTGWTVWALLLLGSTASAQEAVEGEYVLKLQSPAQKYNLAQLASALDARFLETVREDVILIQRLQPESRQQTLRDLKSHSAVLIAEPNYIYRINRLPDDPLLGRLWGLKNTGQADSEGTAGRMGVDIGAERAWDLTTGSRDVVVAVIDTGLNSAHPDLAPNMWVNEAEKNGTQGVDDDGNGFVDDIHGYDFANNDGDPTDDHDHGTHCAGTIGARGNDGHGVVGVSWDVRLMGVKFLTGSGSGTLADAVKSIDYAVANGADILSNSWGGGGASQIVKEAIERARDAGILFVAAAGNDGTNNDTSPKYPASFDVDNILSVAALNSRGELAWFSNYGAGSVHVAAPGQNILSTAREGHRVFSGTSMATPHVSGIAALLLAQSPSLDYRQLRDRIIRTARPLPGLRGRLVNGGIADAYHALSNTLPPPDPTDPTNWANRMDLTISSPHPYLPNTSEEFEVEVPGATRFALHFDRLELENRHDRIEILTADGQSVGVMTGTARDRFSPLIEGDRATLRFITDGSVEKYGFDIDFVAYE